MLNASPVRFRILKQVLIGNRECLNPIHHNIGDESPHWKLLMVIKPLCFRPSGIGYSRAAGRVTFDLQLNRSASSNQPGLARAFAVCGRCIAIAATSPSASLPVCALKAGPRTARQRQPAASRSVQPRLSGKRSSTCARSRSPPAFPAWPMCLAMRECREVPAQCRPRPNHPVPVPLLNYSRAVASFRRFSPSVSIGSRRT